MDDSTHELKGLDNVQQVAEKITEIINARILPLPRYEINSFTEDGKDFLELKIGDGPSTPYYLVIDGRKEAFIRSGNQSIPTPEHILNNLILKGKNLTFDALLTDYKINDLSFTLLAATIKEKTNKKFDENKNIVSDRDLFFIQLYKSIQNTNIRNSTINQIRNIFEKMGYNNMFSREDIKNILNIKDTRATNLISLLLDLNLIIKAEGTKYKFQKQ